MLRAPVAVAATASVLLLGGCATTIEGSEIESEIRADYPTLTGISCPDLKGKKGEEVACDVTFGDFATKARVEVDGAGRSYVSYSYVLDEEPPAEG